jgi:hypothetical protein
MVRRLPHLHPNRRFDMKKIVALIAFIPFIAFAGGEMKEVCHMEKDKAGKEKKVCKVIKVHKKLEGKKVPGQK